MVIFGYQGLLILSLGILLQATGYTRFLVLAVEACVLLLGARYFGGRLARLASAAAFLSAVLTALPHSASAPLAPWPSYLAFSIIIAGYTALVRRDRQQQKVSGAIAICPALTTWFALSAGVFYAWNHLAGITGIGVCSASLMLCYFKLKKPWWLKDLAILSVFPALAGAWGLVLHHHETSTLHSLPLILSLALFTGFAPALSAAWDTFWRKSTQAVTEEKNKMACETVSKAGEPALAWLFSIATWTTILLTAISHPLSGSQWMFAAGAMAISGHGIAQWMQRKSIGFPACAIHLFSFYGLLISGNQTPWLGWLPAFMLLAHLLIAEVRWPVLGDKYLLRLLAFGLLSATGIQAFQLHHQHGLAYPEFLLTGLGLGLLGWNYHRNNVTLAAFAAIPALLISGILSLLMHDHQDGLRYLPILLAMLTHAALWLKKDKDDSWLLPRAALLTASLICLFIASSLHVRASFNGGGLSICWALLALLMFCIGLLMRCRPYRLVGLGWLSASVIHVIAIDVMRLGTLGRILSFIILGLALLILGFLYNRFQDTIRKFL